uniref:Secreted protein n=1 Tax=Trichogramma kaykai TaxID=54128 RepID=A0ABD2WHT0_9HYME
MFSCSSRYIIVRSVCLCNALPAVPFKNVQIDILRVNQGVKNNELPLPRQHMMPRVMYARTQGARSTAASIFSASFVSWVK